ncbi:MBL fold metallo-hydrolase [Candidatus Microgenomates bacterium]|nr:MAG: MBL fold metallo-hydrolase [Candidatus Microgenomates bacterium]
MKAIKNFFVIGFISFVLLGAIFLFQLTQFYDGKLHVVFCNVGQGDGIYIRSPKGLNIVIDGGPDDSILACLAKHMPFWDRKIQLVIMTHPHEDHLTGLIYILKNYKVLNFYSEKVQGKQAYQELTSLLEKKKIKSKQIFRGDRFILKDQVILATIWPKQNYQLAQEADLDANGQSIIELLTFGNFNVLLTGDGKLGEGEDFSSLGVDVLKVAHHGSKVNTNKNILEEINPKLAVITVGKNRFGHPSKETLEALKSLGIKTLRTDLDGDIEVVSDGKTWEIKSVNSTGVK